MLEHVESVGRSIGKTIKKMKVRRLDGQPIDIVHAAMESIGKVFLPLTDCIIGWLIYPNNDQRLFRYISETLMVRTWR